MTDVCREILVALPDAGGDIYRQHQFVWTIMHGKARSGGSSFCYAMRSPQLAVVRSHCLDHGSVVVLTERPMRVTLVTAKQTEGGLVALAPGEAAQRVYELLEAHGIAAADLAIECQRTLMGRKVDRDSGRMMRITLPVSEVRLAPRITHQAKAQLAWRDGVGRGKRFGCGMLQTV